MTNSITLQTVHATPVLKLTRIVFALMLVLGGVVFSSEAFAAKRTPIPRDQASDNITLCKGTGGFIVRTPSMVACCNENSDGTTTCVGCSPDGKRCANYKVRTGSKGDVRRSLMKQAPADTNVVAPGAPSNLVFKKPVLSLRNGTFKSK